jgi:hypothetical protein
MRKIIVPALLGAIGLLTVIDLSGAEIVPAEATPKTNSGAPRILFEKTTYDFRRTSQGGDLSGTFTFKNVGNGALKMEKPLPSCGCTVASVKPDLLQPGDKGELTFTLSLPKGRAALQKTITVVSNDPENPRTVLTVKADYLPLYEVTPATLYVRMRRGETTNIHARVTRTDGKPIQISRMKSSQPWIIARSDPEAASTNGAVRISAEVKPDGKPRYFTELLNVFTEDSERPAFSVAISGRLIGEVTLTPERLYWPATDPARMALTRRVVVTPTVPGKALKVTNVSSSLPEVNVESTSKDNGTTYEIVAKLVKIPDRTTNGVIRFDTDLPGQPEAEIPVTINVVKR